MKFLHAPSRLTAAIIVASSLLSACSEDGTVTVLPARPSVGLALPRVLLDAPNIVQDNLRPLVTLSNGATVSMQRGDGNTWSGTINVAPAAQYLVTVTWVERIEEFERFDGQEIPLAQLTQDLAIAADGTAVQSNTSEYSTDINADGNNGFDFDTDGISNFEERVNGSNPFQNEDQENGGGAPFIPPANDGEPAIPTAPVQPGNPPVSVPVPGNPVLIPVVTPVPDPTTGEELDPVEDPVQEPGTGPSPEADVIVPRIAVTAAPSIDGMDVSINAQNQLTGEWSAAIQFDNSGAPLTINNLMIDIDADAEDGTPHRRWAAMHDGTYLYVLVLVDDDGQRNRDSALSVIDDDSLEIFLDGDNSKSLSYGIDDFHRILPLQLAGADKQGTDSGDVAGPNSSAAPLMLDFATGPGIGPDGIRRKRFEQDVYEVRIQLDSANIDTNAPFGFELQVNDDDDGNTRDAKWAWIHPSRQGADVDGTFTNPSLMGTLVLE